MNNIIGVLGNSIERLANDMDNNDKTKKSQSRRTKHARKKINNKRKNKEETVISYIDKIEYYTEKCKM